MNDGRYSTFIDMKKMKENGLICDEKALIHQRQIDEICRIIKERMEYGEYNPSQKIKSENDVISIFARRGAGKTTFVKSLKKLISEHVNRDEFHGIGIPSPLPSWQGSQSYLPHNPHPSNLHTYPTFLHHL